MTDLVKIQEREPTNRRKRRDILKPIAMAMLAFAVGAMIVILIQNTKVDNDPGLVYEIPEGASLTVPAGLISAVDIPREIVFHDGDNARITVINHDTVTHLAGPFVVGPGETYVQTFPNVGIFPINCAVNPSESIVVKVE